MRGWRIRRRPNPRNRGGEVIQEGDRSVTEPKNKEELGLDEDELDHTKILGALEETAVVRKDMNYTKTGGANASSGACWRTKRRRRR